MGCASKFVMILSAPFPSLLHRPSSLVFLRPLTRCLSITTSPCHFALCFPKSSHQQLHIQPHNATHESNINSPPNAPHPWPEWSHFTTKLFSLGQEFPATEPHGLLPEDAFVAYEEKELSDEFIRCASACLAFARAQPDLLGMLARKDIEVIVSNGTPFLFKAALATARRMRSFLGLEGGNVLESGKANTVDIMKYILSYASNPSRSSAHGSLYSRELVESSVRNLLLQITDFKFGNPLPDVPASDQYQFSGGSDQSTRPLRHNVQMKRGDWICPKCTFMNFARNVKCLECEEPRPKKQLTGGEWACPECNFFNYGRNLVCLRCDCKRPGENVANNVNCISELGCSGNHVSVSNVDSRLVENEEKAKQCFSRGSQLNNASDFSSAAADKDFPEIMRLRKGENRFAVSTRKSQLESRAVNSQNQGHLGNYGTCEGGASQNSANKNLDLSIRKSLDQILARSSSVSRADGQGTAAEQKSPRDLTASPRSSASEFQQPQKSNSHYVPFVPLPADMYSKNDNDSKTHAGEEDTKEDCDIVSSPTSHESSLVTLRSNSQKNRDSVDFAGKQPKNYTEGDKKVEEQDEKSERWFQRVAELHKVKDLPSAISDEDFPEIMPMRRGENRFVVSKKKDRSLTSPAYKKQVAVEQASNSNFVSFVPFPPGYFARKDTQEPVGEHSESSKILENFPEKRGKVESKIAERNSVEEIGKVARNSGQQSPNLSGVFRVPPGENLSQSTCSSQNTRGETQSNTEKNMSQSASLATDSKQMQENKNNQSGWPVKSLEGSAVKEPDPLDMSEEAKAERWFRRVAQIKDISELSQIPDEDFPSIMPMRKGVNRFVLSKRKTPLERRLASPQYRRNLPSVSSDPVKTENDDS